MRLVGRVARDGDGRVSARVAPEILEPDDPLAAARGTTLVTHYEADVFPGGLTITSHDPDLQTTAYGMLADLLDVIGAHGGESRGA
jgi:homoserine dehydrogenase